MSMCASISVMPLFLLGLFLACSVVALRWPGKERGLEVFKAQRDSGEEVVRQD